MSITDSGVTSHRQPRQGPKTVKGAQSDPNYVSRLLLDCVANACQGGGAKDSYATADLPAKRIDLKSDHSDKHFLEF